MAYPKDEKTEKKVYTYVAKHPGSTAEVIKVGTKLDAASVTYRLKSLRLAGFIKGKGTTRATVYSVTKKAFA